MPPVQLPPPADCGGPRPQVPPPCLSEGHPSSFLCFSHTSSGVGMGLEPTRMASSSFMCGACGFSDLTASHLGLKSTFGVQGVCPSFLGAPSALTLPVSPHPCVFTPLHLSAGCWDQRPALCSPEHRVTSPAAYWTAMSQALGQNPSRLSQGPMILSPPNSQRLNSTSGAQLWSPP